MPSPCYNGKLQHGNTWTDGTSEESHFTILAPVCYMHMWKELIESERPQDCYQLAVAFGCQ